MKAQGLDDSAAAALATRWVLGLVAEEPSENSGAAQAGEMRHSGSALTVVIKDGAGAAVLEGTAVLYPVGEPRSRDD